MAKKPRKTYQVKIIIDTNIIFSGLLNSDGTIGDLIFNSDNVFEFYSCTYMREEINKHWGKLKRISKLSDKKLQDSQLQIFNKIHFISEDLIPQKIWLKTEQLLQNIDLDDSDFIALTEYIKGKLWTGDKELYNGLKEKKYKCLLTTQELLKLRNKLTGR